MSSSYIIYDQLEEVDINSLIELIKKIKDNIYKILQFYPDLLKKNDNAKINIEKICNNIYKEIYEYKNLRPFITFVRKTRWVFIYDLLNAIFPNDPIINQIISFLYAAPLIFIKSFDVKDIIYLIIQNFNIERNIPDTIIIEWDTKFIKGCNSIKIEEKIKKIKKDFNADESIGIIKKELIKIYNKIQADKNTIKIIDKEVEKICKHIDIDIFNKITDLISIANNKFNSILITEINKDNNNIDIQHKLNDIINRTDIIINDVNDINIIINNHNKKVNVTKIKEIEYPQDCGECSYRIDPNEIIVAKWDKEF